MAKPSGAIRVCAFINQHEDPELYAALAEPKGRSALARMLLRKGLLGPGISAPTPPIAANKDSQTANAPAATPAVATPTTDDASALQALSFAFDFPAAGSSYEKGLSA